MRYCGITHVRGGCYLAEEDIDRAIPELTRAINVYPKDADLRHWRANCYLDRNDSVHALADLDEAVRLKPHDFSLYFDRARVSCKQGDRKRARADLGHMVLMAPKECGPYFLSAMMELYEFQDWDQALADLDRAAELDPDACLPYLARAGINARKMRLVPTVRDLAYIVMSWRPSEFRFTYFLEWPTKDKLGRFGFKLYWHHHHGGPSKKTVLAGGGSSPDLNDMCIEKGMERLIAAMFGPSR